MAVYQTYQTVGIREDLADIIYSISPTETPFMSGVAKTKATNTSHQWQTDALADVAANAAVEGAAISYGTQSATTKETNYTQISTKAVLLSPVLKKCWKLQLTIRPTRKSSTNWQLSCNRGQIWQN
jgi:hypothetical protein